MPIENVDWGDKLNTVAEAPNAIRKNTGADLVTDAGALSVQSIEDGGYFEFTQPDADALMSAGLGTNPAVGFATITHAFAFNGSGVAEIRELGVYKTDTAYAAGDTFKLSIAGTTVRYYKNGVLVYTSLSPIGLPTKADVSIAGLNDKVTNCVVLVPAGLTPSVPMDYPDARIDRDIEVPGSTPAILRGGKIVDAIFGHEILRVTDAALIPGSPNLSFTPPTAPNQRAWTMEGDRFYCTSRAGGCYVFDVDQEAFTATYNRSVPWGIESAFPRVLGKRDTMYGVRFIANHVVEKYDFTTGAFTTVLDLKTIDGSLTGSVYTNQIYVSGGALERCAVSYGGASQDAHMKCSIFNINDPAGTVRTVHTKNSTINGVACQDQSNNPTVLDFFIHSISISNDGNTVRFDPAGTSSYFWLYDWTLNRFTKVVAAEHPVGHYVLGWKHGVNEDQGAGAKMQWQHRALSLTGAHTPAPCITSPGPGFVYHGDHTSWANASSEANQHAPFFSECQKGGTDSWNYWSNEIIGIRPPTLGSSRVWRFCHHRSNGAVDNNPVVDTFYYQPMLQVDPTGRIVAFGSNWDKTLGNDPVPPAANITKRMDVFFVRISQLAAEEPVEGPVSVPNVISLSSAAGQAAIIAAGLSVGTITTMSSELFAAGVIIGQNPTAGNMLDPGQPVNITVSTGPAPTPPTPVTGNGVLASDVMTEASAVYLNDRTRTRWTDEVLLPYLRSSLRELQAALEENDLPSIHDLTATIPIPQGQNYVPLPSDMVLPLYLEERSVGETSWLKMDEVRWDPDIAPEAKFKYWVYREGIVYIPPATQAREVRLKYVRTLTQIEDGDSVIEVANAIGFLAARTASLASAFGGSATVRATNASERAEMFLKSIIGSLTRRLQNKPVRRRGYRSGYRRH